ncbi:MAG: T9SS type A sorting domain-containing protein [Saprospiraceae bacterium]|uniref:T9SS type A sorting domain-containing protein n=1 Tax=Candidatus Opimibacter skivensis TaxID=2982028 RepID=A0A9D7XSZ0_9BACT|nr:T9SS type A sorting domain-containing protein [Candidatus Opimibacter skivensis]
MKRFLPLVFISCSFILSSQNLILNPSFEQNGERYCEDWYAGWLPMENYCDTFQNFGVRMIHSDPPDSIRGSWSVELYGNWPSGSYIGTYIPAKAGTNVYELKFWMNSSHFGGGGGINLKGNQSAETKWIEDWGQPWTQYTLLDTITAVPGDSIYVILSAGVGDFCICDVQFDQVEFAVVDSITTATNDPSVEYSFTISPNPVINDLHVNTSDVNHFEFTLYDMAGKIIFHQTSNIEKLVIDCSGLASGIYFYEISVDGRKERVGKIMKI